MKKILALLLSVIMVFSFCSPVFAVEESAVGYDGNPVVIVRGIDFRSLVNLDDGTKAMQIGAGDILDMVVEVLLAKFVYEKESLDDIIVTPAMDLVWDIMGPIASNPDGSSMDPNVGMKQYYGSIDEFPEDLTDDYLSISGEGNLALELRDRIGAENVYYFTYDWRKSPEKIASELDDFIKMAQEQSGKKKVHIAALSMGGMVTTAYMYYHGTAALESVAYLSAAHNGTYVCGDALNGRISFTPDTLENMLLSFTGNGGLNFAAWFVLKIARIFGATDILCDFANDFVQNSAAQVYSGGLRDILGTALGMWALCPDEDFASGREFIFSGEEEKYASVLSQLDGVENFVKSTEETINKAYADGVKVVFTSNYNQPLIPIYPRAVLNSDSTLESDLTSNFATIANYGETLSDEYIATKAPEFISADKVIDASTCLYPDYTWFIKDADHVAFFYGTEFSEFAADLILNEEQPTVDNMTDYQRFMYTDDVYNLYPLV